MPIFGLSNWQFYFYGFYFCFLVFVLFLIPGWKIIEFFQSKNYRQTKLSLMSKLFIAPVLGMVALTFVAFFSGLLKIYFLVYLYALGLIIFSLRFIFLKFSAKSHNWQKKVSFLKEKIKSNIALIFLLILGLLMQMPAIFSSGLSNDQGTTFYFTNYQDGLMHLGFIESMAQSWPPARPEVNDVLKDYHYFSDLLWAQLVRLGLPTTNLFFQFGPIFLSLITTGLIYQSLIFITKNKKIAFFTTLVFLLAGDGGYLITFFLSETKGWEMATFDNGADQFLNMPQVFAKTIFFASWLYLNYYWQTKKRKIIFLLIPLLIALTLFKVYWLFFFLGGWGIAFLIETIIKSFQVYKKRKKEASNFKFNLIRFFIIDWWQVGGLFFTALGAIVLLWSIGSEKVNGLVYIPMVWPREIISANHLNWYQWFLEEQNLLSVHSFKTSLQLLRLNLRLVGMTLIFIFGARLLGLLIGKKTIKALGVKNCWFFLTSFFVWFFFGSNYMQIHGGFNTFNFFILAATALLIPLGVNLSIWWGEKLTDKEFSVTKLFLALRKALVIIILVLLSPRTVRNFSYYFNKAVETSVNEPGHFSVAQLDLLAQLRASTKKEDLIGVYYDDRFKEASIVPGLGARHTYLSNQNILKTHDYDFQKKENKVKDIFSLSSIDDFKTAWQDLGVETIILWKQDEKNEYEEINSNLIQEINEQAIWKNEAGLIFLIK